MDGADYLLHNDTDEPPPPPPRPRMLPRILAALVVVAIAVGAYLVYRSRQSTETTPPAATAAKDAGTVPPAQPVGPEALPIDVPPLDESDVLVRQLVKMLSAHPRIAAWLATDDLIRNFTAVVLSIADGNSPAPHLRTLRPSGRFGVTDRGGEVIVDPRSYDRYTPLADAAASVDLAGAARLYVTLKPRIEEAYAELGFPDAPFDPTLERALVRLLATPALSDPVRLRARGAGYVFANDSVEALTPAQKQLLRFGPRNVVVIQEVLRNFALALGIPQERLAL